MMQDILKGLKKDHQDILMLLNAVDRELKLLDNNNQPDYLLLDDILRYSLDYPDRTHHKSEEHLLGLLLENHPDAGDILRVMHQEHEELNQALQKIVGMLTEILNEQPVDKRLFAQRCRVFVGDCRRHILREEAILFPMAEGFLQDKASAGSSVSGFRHYRVMFERHIGLTATVLPFGYLSAD